MQTFLLIEKLLTFAVSQPVQRSKLLLLCSYYPVDHCRVKDLQIVFRYSSAKRLLSAYVSIVAHTTSKVTLCIIASKHDYTGEAIILDCDHITKFRNQPRLENMRPWPAMQKGNTETQFNEMMQKVAVVPQGIVPCCSTYSKFSNPLFQEKSLIDEACVS